MTNDPNRLDAGEAAFFRRQVEHIKVRTYDTKFRPIKFRTLIPVANDAAPGADRITWRQFTDIGLAKVIEDYANDFPRVDIIGSEESSRVYGLGASYGYSIKEIRRAALANLPLQERRARAARRAIEQRSNAIAWSGDAAHNIQGLIDFPGITEYTVPADGTGSVKTWTAKTPDQIVRDLNGLISSIISNTNGVESPDTILLPIEQYLYISDTRMTDGSDRSILAYWMLNHPGMTVDWIPELNGAGASVTDRMMAYQRDADHLTFEEPQPFEQFEPVQKGMEFEIPVHSEVAGVIVYFPLSVAYGDGI